MLLAAGCATGRGDPVDRLAQRPELHEDYMTFALRCSKCHSIARPLSSGITDDSHWDQYVARMRLQPGSGIDKTDAAAILRFLHAYSAEERRRRFGSTDPVPSPPGDGRPSDGGGP